jgi:hypothetical protein
MKRAICFSPLEVWRADVGGSTPKGGGGQIRVAISVVTAAALLACGGTEASTTTAPTTSAPAATTTLPSPVDWSGEFSADLGNDYTLTRCEEGDAPIVCVNLDGEPVGIIEYLILDVATLTFLDGVEDPIESIRLLADDFLENFETDRSSTCPHLTFVALEPEPGMVGGVDGLRFGFSETDGDVEVERNLLMAARSGEMVRLVNIAAVDAGACVSNEGQFLTPGQLAEVIEPLAAVIAVSTFGN